MSDVYIDIDGILTIETIGHDYIKRTPNKGNINMVNRLYKKGHNIILWTSRWGVDDIITRDWLRAYGVKFHKIKYDKPNYEIFIDDRASNTFNCDIISNLLEE